MGGGWDIYSVKLSGGIWNWGGGVGLEGWMVLVVGRWLFSEFDEEEL